MNKTAVALANLWRTILNDMENVQQPADNQAEFQEFSDA